MIFYFIYEILIKKYNVQIVKDMLDSCTDTNKDYPLEEIVINNSWPYKKKRIILDRIIESPEEDDMYTFIEMIV